MDRAASPHLAHLLPLPVGDPLLPVPPLVSAQYRQPVQGGETAKDEGQEGSEDHQGVLNVSGGEWTGEEDGEPPVTGDQGQEHQKDRRGMSD